MSAIRVLVVDDEPHARRGVSRLVAALPGYEVADEVSSGADAVARIRRGGIDVVLLDVQMPEMSGFDVLDAIGADRMPPVVMVTAHANHAARAFEVAVTDYILKPFTTTRLAQALARAVKAVPSRSHFVIVNRGVRTVVMADDVEWISGAGYYSRLHVPPRVHLVRESLQAIEARLSARTFVRVHRSAIVNLSRIREVRRSPTGVTVAVLASGARVRVSRRYRVALAVSLRPTG